MGDGIQAVYSLPFVASRSVAQKWALAMQIGLYEKIFLQ